jgi:uncharacterized UBP type Zn finger protein
VRTRRNHALRTYGNLIPTNEAGFMSLAAPLKRCGSFTLCGKREVKPKEDTMAVQLECSHIKEIREVQPSANGCEDCLKTGDSWVHLRMCLICGHVGCCDSSKNKHATKHFHRSKHPIVQSMEPGEDWRWCYVDELMLD